MLACSKVASLSPKQTVVASIPTLHALFKENKIMFVFIMDYKISLAGCSAHTCYIKRPIGQAHNGSCKCLDHVNKKDLIAVRKVLLKEGFPK